MKALLVVLAYVGSFPLAQTFSATSGIKIAPPPSCSSSRTWGTPASTAAQQLATAAPRLTPVRPRTALGAAKLAVDVGDVRRGLSSARERLEKNRQLFDEAKLEGELEYLEGVSSEADFWNDANSARKTLGDLNRLKLQLDRLHRWRGWEADAETVIELCGEEEGGDEETVAMLDEAMEALQLLQRDLDAWELQQLLSGKYDNCGCRLTIMAGAGGTEAQDWAEMLQRMYIRFFQRRGFKYKMVEEESGEVAGIKSCEMQVEGDFAYGYLAGEKGTHRLVRQSPFNAQAKRQTSFAGVESFPIIEQDDLSDLVVPEGELEVSTMRSGGSGGQNVNKVETGVRMKHIPTGIAVRCTQERSQMLNKELALNMLKEKLVVVMQEQQTKDLAEIRGDMVEASWGQQIRNYVFHPYKLVKDTRTGAETVQVQDVMDGDLDALIEAYLRHARGLVGAEEVGREKGHVPPPRLKDNGVQRQGERDAFGARTERFSKLTNDVPPPGAYYRRSTLERDGNVCGSVSAKGYGTGFVSNAPRFKNLNTLQQAYLPGPGSYTIPAEGVQEGTKLTSFSSLKRDHLGIVPGPGEYNTDRGNRNNTANKNRAGASNPTSSFLCARTPLNVGTHLETPAPGTYELLPTQQSHVDKSGNILKDPFFRSQTRRNASFIAASDVPGPGEYDVDRGVANSTEAFGSGGGRGSGAGGRPSQQLRRGGGGRVKEEEEVTPGPGWYTPHQTKAPERFSSSSSMFRSGTKRFAGIGPPGAPGPAFYQPEPLGKKSFRWNATKQWV
ncbi:unnamed protein product [Ectocarpus sp. 12 AP-2014]